MTESKYHDVYCKSQPVFGKFSVSWFLLYYADILIEEPDKALTDFGRSHTILHCSFHISLICFVSSYTASQISYLILK